MGMRRTSILFASAIMWAAVLAAPSLPQGKGPPPQIPDVGLLVRNYTGNLQATDRVWFYTETDGTELEEGGGQHPSIEWDGRDNRRPGPNVTGVVYVNGTTSVTLTITIRNESYDAVTGTFTLQAARLKIPAPNEDEEDWEYDNLSVSPSSAQTINLPSYGSENNIAYTFSGLPETVALGQLEVKYDMPLTVTETSTNGNNGSNGAFWAWEWIYVVDEEPVGLQEVPWTDFLQYTCRWAYGASGASEVRTELARGLHYSNRSEYHRVNYNGGGSSLYYPVSPSGSAGTSLSLKNLTIHLDANLWTPFDCRDFAAVLWLAFQSQGLVPRYDLLERWNGSSVPGGFYTWPLCPSGTDSTDSGNRTTDLGNYQSYGFGYHCVVESGGYRFESSCSYLWDYDSEVWENPVWYWGLNDHWQKYTLVVYAGFAYGTVAAAYPFNSGTSLPFHIKPDLDPDAVE